jgi:UDP-3-O-[3-hydroxymyristoyl] glucosamine N-acyltransferase
MLVGYAKIAGSVKIGKNVMVAGDVDITGHATIGDNCVIGGGSKVHKNLKPGAIVWGAPAKPISEEKRIQVLLRKLPEMYQAIKKVMHTS